MMEYAGIDAARLEAMEERLKKDVLAEVGRGGREGGVTRGSCALSCAWTLVQLRLRGWLRLRGCLELGVMRRWSSTSTRMCWLRWAGRVCMKRRRGVTNATSEWRPSATLCDPL